MQVSQALFTEGGAGGAVLSAIMRSVLAVSFVSTNISVSVIVTIESSAVSSCDVESFAYSDTVACSTIITLSSEWHVRVNIIDRNGEIVS